jgi:hypothetical protein
LDNISRLIPSGLTVAGWYTSPDKDGLCAVHVDLVFSTAKFGGDEATEIEFELRLRRCELVIVPVDAVRLKISTLARSYKNEETSLRMTDRRAVDLKAQGKIGASTASLPTVDASASGSFDRSFEEIREATRTVRDFVVQHGLTADRHPKWEISKSNGAVLQGSPWDATTEPRVRFEQVPSKISHQPYIRLELRCRREDLDFGDGIRLKDESKKKLFRAKRNRDANLAAAEQYIKKVLIEEGLTVSNIAHKFGEITLADVVIAIE